MQDAVLHITVTVHRTSVHHLNVKSARWNCPVTLQMRLKCIDVTYKCYQRKQKIQSRWCSVTLKSFLTKTVFMSPFWVVPKRWMVQGGVLGGWIVPQNFSCISGHLCTKMQCLSHTMVNVLTATSFSKKFSKPSLIMQGSIVICFTDLESQQKYINCLSFLSKRLATMPAALGLVNKIKL